MKKMGIPVIDGSDGVINNVSEAEKLAEIIGYPIILKASAGGGGKGMRLVENVTEIENAFNYACKFNWKNNVMETQRFYEDTLNSL